MSRTDFKLTVCDLGLPKPMSTRLLLGQFYTEPDDWIMKDGLFFPRRPNTISDRIDKILAHARQAAVDMVILPELSVPEECLAKVQGWSEQTGSIVIAGSHYHLGQGGFVARTPIVVGGAIFFTEKIVPAPVEISPIQGQG